MPSLKEIKGRIASVNSTRKITSAMKMVASSKLHHAQVMIENMLPYEHQLDHILKTFLQSGPETATPLSEQRAVKRVALVVYSSNSSLCGGFNANVIKQMLQFIDEYSSLGKENILIYPIGRKVSEKVVKLGFTPAGQYLELAEKPNAAQCSAIADELMRKYVKGEVDRVEIIYHHFRSAASQTLERQLFMPIDISKHVDDDERDLSSQKTSAAAQEYLKAKGGPSQKSQSPQSEGPKIDLRADFIVEPDIKTVLRELVPKELHLKLYTALLDSNASEHAARMVAMQTATDNADELLRGLNLQYNKSRQQAITSELLDIVGGSMN
jgi:F-type H+-transporting ATPase subunit gamma